MLGHNPLGALSVLVMLLVLFAQVSSGLFSDDEIATSGPLSRFVSGEWVSRATDYHTKIGKYLLLALVCRTYRSHLGILVKERTKA